MDDASFEGALQLTSVYKNILKYKRLCLSQSHNVLYTVIQIFGFYLTPSSGSRSTRRTRQPSKVQPDRQDKRTFFYLSVAGLFYPVNNIPGKILNKSDQINKKLVHIILYQITHNANRKGSTIFVWRVALAVASQCNIKQFPGLYCPRSDSSEILRGLTTRPSHSGHCNQVNPGRGDDRILRRKETDHMLTLSLY